jgi:hypothetical protein
MDPKQGIPLAEQNYRAECRLHGRKPDMEFFRASMAKALARDVTPRYNEVREPYIDGEPRRS